MKCSLGIVECRYVYNTSNQNIHSLTLILLLLSQDLVSSQFERTVDINAQYVDGISASVAPPNPGWTISGGGGGASDGGNGGITNAPDIGASYGAQYANFYGPFSGSGNSIIDNQWFLTQEFYCSNTASVNVSFYYAWCGNTESADYAVLYLNDMEQPNTRIQGDSTSWDGSVPISVNDELIAASGCYGWYYKGFGFDTNSISRVDFGELFKISFEFALSASNEWASVTGINVRCTQIPTSSPTMEPSLYPTMEPSTEPTEEPSFSTSQPSNQTTSDPSTEPTAEPSLEPTFLPTTFPSTEPTSKPSAEPTSKLPTNSPSPNPSTLQSTSQSTTNFVSFTTNDPSIAPSGIKLSFQISSTPFKFGMYT